MATVRFFSNPNLWQEKFIEDFSLNADVVNAFFIANRTEQADFFMKTYQAYAQLKHHQGNLDTEAFHFLHDPQQSFAVLTICSNTPRMIPRQIDSKSKYLYAQLAMQAGSLQVFQSLNNTTDVLNLATAAANHAFVNAVLANTQVQPNEGTLLKAYLANDDALIDRYKNTYNITLTKEVLTSWAAERGHMHVLKRLATETIQSTPSLR